MIYTHIYVYRLFKYKLLKCTAERILHTNHKGDGELTHAFLDRWGIHPRLVFVALVCSFGVCRTGLRTVW